MMAKNVLDLIHDTPMLRLNRNVYAKLEYMNLTGSTKDRMVKYMLEQAEKEGKLKRGYTIVEATSGNTGIAVSMIGKLKGYKVKILMPKYMSCERKLRIHAEGAELVLTKNMQEAQRKAEELGKRKGYFYLNQFGNPNNVLAHQKFTAREILKDMKGKKINAFVAAIGTGGTIMGIGQALRKKFPKVKLIGVLPRTKKDLIEGIGYYYKKEIVNLDFLDDVVKVSRKTALKTAREMLKTQGLFVGESSGANYHAARNLGTSYTVTVLPDSGDRYITTELWQPKGLKL